MGPSRTMSGRGFNQVVQIVLYNFINLSLTRKESICIFFTMGKERSRQKTFKVTSALKLPLLLRIQRTDPPTRVSYFPWGSCSFTNSHPTALLSESICSFSSALLIPRSQDFWLLIHQQHLKKGVLELKLAHFQHYPCRRNRKLTFSTVLD